MVAGDGNSIPLRYILGAILKDVGNQTHGRTWREDISTTCSVLLQNIVLNSTLQLVCRHALLLSHCNVHSQQYGSRSIDSHGSRNLAQVNLVKEDFHISQGVDSNAYLANLALRDRIIRVITNLGWQVKCAGEAGSAGLNQVTITLVGLSSSGEACIHAHGPETATIHGRLHAAGIRIHARIADFISIVGILDVQWSVQTLLRQVWTLREAGNCLFYAGIVLI